MPTIHVDGLTFDFPNGWVASKYDDWAFYTRHFRRCRLQGVKAVDIVAIEPRVEEEPMTLWLIEVKDYRASRRTNPQDLVDQVCGKAVDTLAALLPATIRANVDAEQRVAGKSLKCKALRLVLHLEVAVPQSPVFDPRLDKADIKSKLQSQARAIDPRALVTDLQHLGAVPWTVR